MTKGEEPSDARTMAGCAAAVLVAGISAAVAIWWQMPEMGVALLGLMVALALPFAAAHALLLGIPLYLLLRRRWRLRWWNAALGGFVVAVIPIGLLSVPRTGASIEAMRELAETGLFGLAGGVAFWIVLRDPRPAGR